MGKPRMVPESGQGVGGWGGLHGREEGSARVLEVKRRIDWLKIVSDRAGLSLKVCLTPKPS